MAFKGTPLLVELGTEELPPLAVRPALEQLRENARALFEKARLRCGDLHVLGTSRRLVLYTPWMEARQQDLVREVRGPAAKVAYDPEGKPTRAAEGFARGQGLPVERLARRTVAEGEYVFAEIREAGRSTIEVLADLLPELFGSLRFPQAMRWGSGEVRFARPVRWMLALLGSRVIPARFAGVEAGNKTCGHRLLAPRPCAVKNLSDYRRRLRTLRVVLDPAAREQQIRQQAAAAAAKAGGEAIISPDLLEEIVFSAEHPAALSGKFDPKFLDLPREVLVTVMQHHQKYFAVQDARGRLLPTFVAVRDGGTRHAAAVRQGHEWVLRARLADARFFFVEDRKRTLDRWAEGLRTLVFQERLGTMADKTARLAHLAPLLGASAGLGDEDLAHLRRAAVLCKADLITHMVREFPELQGVMGREYARLAGEPETVAAAIEEHYRPRGAEDDPPRTRVDALLALADRMDTLVGHLAAGMGARGSEDPYGLRRAAAGVVSSILTHELAFNLDWLVDQALAGYDAMPAGAARAQFQDAAQVAAGLRDLVMARLRGRLQEEGISYDVIDAALAPGDGDLLTAAARARALAGARQWDDFPRLFVAYDRVSRILPRGEERVSVEDGEPRFLGRLLNDPAAQLKPAERDLIRASCAAAPLVEDAVRRKDYLSALQALRALADPIDRYFDDVLIMDPDPQVRGQRLRLMRDVAGLFLQVADLSKIVMPGGPGERSATGKLAPPSPPPGSSSSSSKSEILPRSPTPRRLWQERGKRHS
ncbi:MAG: glycine--tRNA ligase subunit beta [Armatimonadetes bacterium]|nr:glycine--tRNA ligase subunit beta [Armatimonadota bacterium]